MTASGKQAISVCDGDLQCPARWSTRLPARATQMGKRGPVATRCCSLRSGAGVRPSSSI
jgi:hypothetical protein